MERIDPGELRAFEAEQDPEERAAFIARFIAQLNKEEVYQVIERRADELDYWFISDVHHRGRTVRVASKNQPCPSCGKTHGYTYFEVTTTTHAGHREDGGEDMSWVRCKGCGEEIASDLDWLDFEEHRH